MVRTTRQALCSRAFGFCLCLLAGGLAATAGAQSTGTDAAAGPVAPIGSATAGSVVRWTGSLPEAAGRTVQMRFALYQDQAGGLALWSETQTVKVGADGRYSVLLGVTSAEGLPQTLFQAGEARWIEAQLVTGAGGDAVAESSSSAAPPRSLLAAVPYAFKSVDAETLAGRSAADYVTHEDLQSAVTGVVQASTPNSGTTVTGTGTSGYVPEWTSASTLGNSVIAESGTKIGIDTASPATSLDVNGASTLRGAVSLPAAAATTTAGVNSPALELGASAWSTKTKAAVAQNFQWRAVATGNNTASPTANLELLFGSGTTAPMATGLTIAPTGQFTFAAGQEFPGTLGSVTAASPITQTTNGGAVSLGLSTAALETSLNGVYAQLGAANAFAKPITFAAGQKFPGAGTITGVTAGSGLKGGGTTGAVSLAVDPTVVPLRMADNIFTGKNTFTGGTSFLNGIAANEISSDGTITGGGLLTVNPFPTATAANTGGESYLSTAASVFNSSSKQAGQAGFLWNAAPVGNNTSSPSAQLNLMYGTGSDSLSFLNDTGLSINWRGIVTFAKGQTFHGTISGVSAASPLTASTNSGVATVGLNTTTLETTLNSVYPQLAATNNTFSGEIQAASFSGNGASLTSLTPANLSAGTAAISISGNAASITGSLPVAQVTGAATLASNTFTGSQTINGSLSATSFSGNGAFLTSLTPANLSAGTAAISISGNAASITGSLPVAQVTGAATLASNTFTGSQTINGSLSATSFSGDGSNVSNVNAAKLGGFTASQFQPSGSYATLGPNTFSGDQNVNGFNVYALNLISTSEINAGSTSVVDEAGANNGGSVPGLSFGGGGETIASNRTGSPNQYGLDFFTGYTSRMSITNSGAVGIGTQNPNGDMLEVSAPAESNLVGGHFYGASSESGNTTYGVVGWGGNDNNGSYSGGDGGGFFGGNSSGGTAGDGVYASTGGGSGGYAGFFQGNVNVNGTVNSAAINSKIDHPLSPADKYLVHASVESSEMMNIYSGNITTDAQGEARVELPEWFEAENTDFRYQLTVVGQFAQAIVASEIANHSFRIKSDKPNVKVSWQVTGIRQDAYAKAHPLQVEVDKSERERGYYMNPELYGAPEERGIEWARHPEMMKRMKELRARQHDQAAQRKPAPVLRQSTTTRR